MTSTLPRRCWLLLVLLCAQAGALAAQGGQLPFSPEENKDGARFVWFVMRQSGFPYDYIPADSIPTSSEFREVESDSARAGDLAWWPHFIAVYSGPPNGQLILVADRPTLSSVVTARGTPRFYRKLVPIDRKSGAKPSDP